MLLGLLNIPPEVILYIFSFLDLPDLASVSEVSPFLSQLASDPALHRVRIRVVTPSRVNHSLFGQSSNGLALRPTFSDLVHRGVVRGLGIERRWRMGLYFYSHLSVRQYEASLRLERRHAKKVLSSHLRNRTYSLKSLHEALIFPDVESSSANVSRTLLPIVRKLKWSLQRDKLAKIVREGACIMTKGTRNGETIFGTWLDSKGKGVVQDGERTRLAVCPGIRHIVGFYEKLGC